jgi:hypothetical protein
MEKDFLLKDKFREYRRKGNKPYEDVNTCMTELRKLFEKCKSIPLYEKECFFYVPSLIASNHKDLAMKLLTCTYADILPTVEPKNISFFKRYCKFISNESIDNIEPLDEGTLNNIRECLQNREVWICNPDFSGIFRVKNTDKTLWQLFRIRVLSWNRRYFPLDFIKKVLNKRANKKERKIIENWVTDTIKNINVLARNDKNEYQNLKFSDVCLFELHRPTLNKSFEVYVIKNKGNKEKLTLMTPSARSETPKVMEVKGLKDISIDHLIPLELIVRQLREDEKTALRRISDEYEKDPESAAEVFNDSIISKLGGELETIRKDAHCRLMQRNENSIKSNNTSYVKYEEDDGVYKFIISEDVLNPADNMRYTIYQIMEKNVYSEIKMAKKGERLI